jgi:serine/threonine protein kinase
MALKTIAGRYEVERTIGKGGMGTVWLARDKRLGRDVAVKQIGILPGETAPHLARAMREARSAAVLNHPHVVSIYDVVEESDQIWLVMEYVPCRTLWQIINHDGPLAPEDAVGIVAQVAEGLVAVHAAGTIHRDVKPANILVTEEGVAKISDFGIARAHDQGQLTRTGMVIGTPEYFAPELARGEDPTPAVDVWALGATLYAAVEGRPPYPHQSNALALLATIASTPPPRAEKAGFLTEPIARMLDPNPESRWSMKDAAHMLRRLHERHPREFTRQSTSELPTERGVAAMVPDEPPVAASHAFEPSLDLATDEADHPSDERRPRALGGRLLLAGLAGLLALGVLGGYLLLHDGSTGQPSATSDQSTHTGSSGHAPGKHHKSRLPGSTSTTATSPLTSPPTNVASSPTPPQTQQPVTGGSAEQFVRSYYSALPSNTRSAWAALSPSFQSRIGGYDQYRGFWSTISSVSVGGVKPAGSDAVDVSLTYTSNNARVDREVRRLYLVRSGTRYVIDHDAIVG